LTIKVLINKKEMMVTAYVKSEEDYKIVKDNQG